MIIHALKFRQDSGQNLHILDKKMQTLHCVDAHLSRSLSQVFYRILASEKTLAAKLPLSVSTDIPGQGNVSALLSSETDTLQDSVPSMPLGNDASELLGADLLILSFEELLESGKDVERIALEMAAIADTGNCNHGLIAALARLDGFVENIGRGKAADTALSRAKAQLESLKTERAALKAALEQAAKFDVPLHESRTQVEQCRARRNEIEKALCASIVHHVTRFQEELKAVERQRAGESDQPSLDSEQAAAIQRAENLFETARLQLERSQEELRTIRKELEESQNTGISGTDTAQDVPEVFEQLQQRIQGGQGRITEFNARLDEVTNQIGALDTHICDAQEQLTGLPDFSRIAPNPIDWLNQLARSFKTALTMRDGEEESRDAMRTEMADLRVEIAGDAAIFEGRNNFAEELIVHHNKKKQWETRSAQIEERVRHNRSLRDEAVEKVPGLFMLSLGCALFLALLLGAYVGLQKAPILYPCGFVLLSTLFFLGQLLATRSRVTRLTRNIAEGQAELDVMNDEEKSEVSQVDRLMARADCRTARELEARYDYYRELRTKLDAVEAKYHQQEEHLRESEERIPKLFERVRSTLEQVDETPRNEDDVENAVGRAIAKYQVYRETKRRLADLRNQHQGLLSRRRFLEKELDKVREGLPEAEQKLREIMREQGFNAEAEHRDIGNALAAYYRFLDTHEKDTGRRSALIRERQSLEARLPEEEALFNQHKRSFETLLKQAGFNSLEQAREAATSTNALRDLEQEKKDLEHQCEALLQGRTLEHWRKLAGNVDLDEDDPGVEQYTRQLEAIEAESDAALRQYRSQYQERQQTLAAHRSLCEIEEDMAALSSHIEVLRNDVSAAAHASALTEESLHTSRARIGEALAERASEKLETLGISALLHLDLDPNKVPAIEMVTENDQATVPVPLINLALRLAAAELLINADSPRPLIVDATLQDAALPVAPEKLIAALAECAKYRQVLLVFESEQIAAAAGKKQVPLLKF